MLFYEVTFILTIFSRDRDIVVNFDTYFNLIIIHLQVMPQPQYAEAGINVTIMSQPFEVIFLSHISSRWVKVRLHTEKQLLRLP